ncbi:MAG: dihydroorotate dehydrogenase electron transfer subunit [Clostridiales bacterium]|nr:dihydroorotate dehydrogenase electron transfer subunit [Clostridiales bacterium]
MIIQEAQVLTNERIGLRYYALTVSAPQISVAARPGQFLMIAPRSGMEPFLKRPLGINVIDMARGQIRVVYRVVGYGTRLLSERCAGEFLQVVGPLGNGWQLTQGRHVLLVGGGAGIAPLLPLAVELARSGADCEAMLGASSVQEVPCVEEFATLARLSVATLDGSRGALGQVSSWLPAQPIAYDMIYCCGPHPLMRKVALWAKRHDLPCQVSLEEHMGCGFGVCMGCVCAVTAPDKDEVIYKRVCCEGPVFDSREVRW